MEAKLEEQEQNRHYLDQLLSMLKDRDPTLLHVINSSLASKYEPYLPLVFLHVTIKRADLAQLKKKNVRMDEKTTILIFWKFSSSKLAPLKFLTE